MSDCVFCKIIAGEIPSFKIWEDQDFLAFLDINPNVRGTTLVVSKEHFNSNPIEVPDVVLAGLIKVAKAISVKLCSALSVKRVGFAIDGTGINHLHMKLYPFHGLNNDFHSAEDTESKPFFEVYPGYLTTQVGPQADFGELQSIAQSIQSVK